METNKDKSIRLLNYLEEIAKLKFKTVYKIDSYHEVLWLKDIPHDKKHCFTRAWVPEEDIDKDIWIQIKNYKEPELEKIPDICEDWADNEDWADYKVPDDDEKPPELKDSRVIEEYETNQEWSEGDPEEERIRKINRSILLQDFPEVSSAWNEYVQKKWEPWAELHKEWNSVYTVYSKLHSIHREQLKEGEKYELILGIGYLQWDTDRGKPVERHVIVANANLDFDSKSAKITVGPSTDGAKLSLEFDMFEPEDRPPLKAVESIEKKLSETNDDPWDKDIVDDTLRSIVHYLGKGDGQYRENGLGQSLLADKGKPLINFSPALILRKRNVKVLQKVIQRIRGQINDGGDIPKEFIALIEGNRIKEDSDLKDEYRDKIDGKKVSMANNSKDKTIYFPLPSNKEQYNIIEKASYSSAVLVQGPPGTGKSHTIANLICHLLATGKRVLVTASMPRALRVLKDKLPKEIQPLCINLLGSGIEEQESLKSSVNIILSEQNQWDEIKAKEKFRAGYKEFYNLREEKAALELKIRKILESVSYKYSIVDNKYNGTKAQIVNKVKEEKERYGWFEDKTFDDTCPYEVKDLIDLKNDLKELDPEEKQILEQDIPKLGELLPSIEEFLKKVQEEKRLQGKTSSKDEILKTDKIGEILTIANDAEAIRSVMENILKLNAAVDSISKRPLPWIKRAVSDMLSDKDTPWKDKRKRLKKRLVGLKKQSYAFETTKPDYPSDIPESKLKLIADIKDRYQHFKNGGKKGFGFLAPKIVKETRYIENVKIDGRACDSLELMKKTIDFLELEQKVWNCWSLWGGSVETKKDLLLFEQIGELEELLEALEGVVGLYEYLEAVKASVRKIDGLGEVAWHDKEERHRLLEICEVYALRHIKDELAKLALNTRNFIKTSLLSHPSAKKLIPAIKNRDVEEYTLLLNKINMFEKTSKAFNDLKQKIPIFAQDMLIDVDDFEEKLYQFEDAWDWARANFWVEEKLKEEDDKSLEDIVKRIEEDINDKLAELASLKAWKFCFSRMDDHHRKHLIGWQQAMKKLGKGTGKHAPKHRKDAKLHLNKCKDAVPAWVMPLHRVYETVEARPEAFDLIIVDEASQCGPEGLPLTYIGKQLIIVGDDQQISPDAIGVKKDLVQELREKYLSDFEHADSFSPNDSLFDHGNRRFDSKIVLKEHFRCVPEIIGFSNDLCYSATRLITLRQYPPKRLKPLNAIHVEEGFREGDGSNAINKPEADAIVKKIVECCNDEEYDGKTMGVIVLQGYAQASLIEERLLKELGAEEMEQRRLICGAPYSFQGDERNIIFLSMIADADVKNVFSKESDKRRFNVAASRAQDQMWLFHTATETDLPKNCLRRRLLEHFHNPSSQISNALGEDAENLRKRAHSANRSIEKPPRPFDSWFEVDVALMIANRGYRVVPQFPIAGKRIDLVIEGNKSKLAVECDGERWHSGLDKLEDDMERQRMLERCGWDFFRVKDCAFIANPEKALEKLWDELKERSIFPVSFENNFGDNSFDKEVKNKTIETKEEMAQEKPIVDEASKKTQEHKTYGEFFKQVKERSIFPVSFENNFGDNSFDKEVKNKTIETQEEVAQEKPIIDEAKLEKDYQISNIHEAMALMSSDIKALIVKILRNQPNFSCVKSALAGLILKDINVISRGKRRKKFMKKVDLSLGDLEHNNIVEADKGKNAMVRLIIDTE